MGALFWFQVESVSPPSLRVHAETVHQAWDEIPRSRSFALGIIVDRFAELVARARLFREAGEADPACAAAIVAAQPARHRLERWAELMIGRELPISPAEHQRLAGDPEEWRKRNVAVLSPTTVRLRPDHAAFIAAADSAIEAVTLEGERRDLFDAECEVPYAAGTLAINVRDPGLLAHLGPGDEWESAVYDYQA